jgi:DNA-binding MarR family transcriptional regulator
MDPQDIRSLQLLEEIENNYGPSQRDLARKLNISLGLVNSFIKRLATKGYVKITNIPRNRVRYILTPKGFAEKSRLTYEFIQYSFRFYKKAVMELHELADEFRRKEVRKVVFFGANNLAEIASISLRGTDVELIGVVDDERAGEEFLGFRVKSIKDLRNAEYDKIIITRVNSQKMGLQKLLQNEIPREKIVVLGEKSNPQKYIITNSYKIYEK